MAPGKNSLINEEEEILRDVCSVNGLNFSKLHQDAPQCTQLEMFFSGFPRMVGLYLFPNLTTLCIMGQAITRLEGLSPLVKLRELWVSECQVQRIECLDSLKQLQKLYLYSNNIQKIENLGNLVKLQVLWLNGNMISVIEGLTGLQHLRELNLSDNEINKVGNSLTSLPVLENVELSGNRLTSLKDLTSLARVPTLLELGIKSPLSSANPVGLLCNYTTHVLYHLPQLITLDGQKVNVKMIKELAESTVAKKKMFYHMKVKVLQRYLARHESNLHTAREQLLSGPSTRMRALMSLIKKIEQEKCDIRRVSTSDTNDSGTESDKEMVEKDKQPSLRALDNKLKALKERYAMWNGKCAQLEKFYNESILRLHSTFNGSLLRLTMELETGGNVRFDDGSLHDPWFSTCHDLVLSRFCAVDYRDYNVVGIKIHRITRIHNRMLRIRFDQKISQSVDSQDSYLPQARNTQYRKQLEYLFWVWEPDLPGGQDGMTRSIEEGFMDAGSYKQLGCPAAVPLTNSLQTADRPRMACQALLAKNKSKENPEIAKDTCPFRFGQLMIVKVYMGKSQQYNAAHPLERAYYPQTDTVYQPKKDLTDKVSDSHASSTNPSSSMLLGSTAQCECNNKQCAWYAFDHELVLPEYIVDFEYVTRSKVTSPFDACTVSILETTPINLSKTAQLETVTSDDDVLRLQPEIKPKPRLVTLTPQILLDFTKASSLENISLLNLHGNGLTRLSNLSQLTSLKTLVVSFNELTHLEDVANMSIHYLDVSFNKITTLEGFKSMKKISYLDLSWNQLTNTRDDISILRKHTPELATLDLSHNPWQKSDSLRLRAIGRIKSLTKLNSEPVTEAEATAALRLAAGSRISQVSLLTHSRTDKTPTRTLGLGAIAQVLSLVSRHKPDRVGEQDNKWFATVTTLNLDSQHISKLSNLERLENLKWASFCNNHITKIEGLENCKNLEELSLDNNCITKLEGVTHLHKLSYLSLSHNYIKSVDVQGLEKLSKLTYLSLSDNKISSLVGIQRFESLQQFYIGNNLMTSIREIFNLKPLSTLMILDVMGNSLVNSTNNYRLFVVFHLKALRALDGIAIESSESSEAREVFGGRLTSDFVAERFGHANFREIRELDIPSCAIKTVDLGTADHFHNLRSVNLEKNNLSSFSGLIYLVNLRVLCLNHNHIESIVPRPKNAPTGPTSKVRTNLPSAQPNGLDPESYTPVLENLEVLHLGYNGIKDMSILQLGRLPSLKALFLQGNEISRVEGLEGLQDLRELVLDRNRIKSLTELSLTSQWNLQELHMEENRIRDLSFLGHLENLQRLFLGMNRIQDMAELSKLDSLQNLVELSVISNAVNRRMLHRPWLVYYMPQLLVIDGIPISEEERGKSELYFLEQQNQVPVPAALDTTLPGINQYKQQPVRVNTVQLMSGATPALYQDRAHNGIHYNEEALQMERGRKRGQRVENLPTSGQQNKPTTANNVSIQHTGPGAPSQQTGFGMTQQHFVNSRSQPNNSSDTDRSRQGRR